MAELIYQEPQQQFLIDACLPQISAAKQGKVQLKALSHGNYPGKLLPRAMLPEISSLGFLDAVGDQDWGMEDHRNEGIEICMQISGENTLTVDGKKYPMPAGTVSITRPWQLHRIGDPYLGPGRLLWIIIDVGVRRPNQEWRWPDWCVLTKEDLDGLSQLLRGNDHPVWNAGNELDRVFRELASYCSSASPAGLASRMMIAVNQLLVEVLDLLRDQPMTVHEQPSMVARTVELFLIELSRNQAMLETPWTLRSMAAHCGIGRSAFTRYCHRFHNLSPVNYLNRCRLTLAANRLKTGATSVTDVALDLGFSSSQYFSRAFKQQFGVTPSQWRIAACFPSQAELLKRQKSE